MFSVNDPPHSGKDVTPDDSNDLGDGACRGLTCTGSGTASVIYANDNTPVTIYLTKGGIFSGFIKRVLATGTAATGIVALY